MSEAIDPLLERHRADLAALPDAAADGAREGTDGAQEGPLGLSLEPEEARLLASLSGDVALADRERRIADSFALVLALRAIEATPEDAAARDELRAQAVEVQLAFEIQAEMREEADPLADRAQHRAAAVLEALDAPAVTDDRAGPGPGIAARRIDLEATLLPVAWEINRRMDGGELPAIVLEERRRDLIPREKAALVSGATEHPSSLDRLLTLCAAVSVKVAADLDLLGASWEMETSEDPEVLAVDAAALAHLLDLASDALELARNRTQSEAVQALTPVRSRLEALDGLLAERAPQARVDRAAVSVESALSLLDFDAPPAAPRAKPEPPPDPSIKDKAERSSKRIRRRASSGPRWRAPVLVALSIVLIGGAAWYVRRAARDVGPSRVGESLAADELAASLPSATVLEVDPESRRARIAVGPEWERWDRAEQRRRVLSAVTALADRGYSSITFERGGFGVVATYHDGIVDLGD